MEEQKKVYVVVGIVAVAALLLSCIFGALAGGAAGLVVGRRQARAAVQEELQNLPSFRNRVATPQPREIQPPSGVVPSGMAGALITEVISGSPAEQAGLKADDLITAIDSIPIDSNHPLADIIGQYQPGDQITVHFWRAGQEQTARVQLAQNPDNPGHAYLGVYFQMVGGQNF
jgi:membrane-associated protease RseP (regulator of RpoE activity)